MRRRELYDDGLQQLQQLNRYEDIFDVFINIIIRRAPTIFILINMTLMIWMVQIIFSSRLDSIPHSTYLYAPFLAAKPFLDLQMVSQKECPKGFQVISLKPFPKIKQENITGLNLTHWEQQKTKFCAKTSQQKFNFTKKCDPSLISCSGFCVETKQSCPITGIKRIHANEPIPQGFEQFYNTSDGLWKYVFTKNSKKTFITGLTVVYEEKCANDYPLYDEYKSFTKYWNKTKQCGEEGTIVNDYYNKFDDIIVRNLFENNGIMLDDVDTKIGEEQYASLGYMTLIKFPETKKCQQAQQMARNIQKFLVTPTFTQSLLVVCFIFFTGSWAWLIGFYCFETKRRQKNIIVILMSIIELIVVVFSYTKNTEMFYTESIIKDISLCIQDDLDVARHWQFGIQSSSPFMSIIFCCCSFLLLQITAHLIDMNMYDSYHQPRAMELQNDLKFHCDSFQKQKYILKEDNKQMQEF